MKLKPKHCNELVYVPVRERAVKLAKKDSRGTSYVHGLLFGVYKRKRPRSVQSIAYCINKGSNGSWFVSAWGGSKVYLNYQDFVHYCSAGEAMHIATELLIEMLPHYVKPSLD